MTDNQTTHTPTFKYTLGQEIHFMKAGKPTQSTIILRDYLDTNSIINESGLVELQDASLGFQRSYVEYCTEEGYVPEAKAYASREDLLNSLNGEKK